MFDDGFDTVFFDYETPADKTGKDGRRAATDLITSDRNLLVNTDENPMVHDRNALARDYDALLRHAK